MTHDWITDANGEVDHFAHDVETETQGHNGPCCRLCQFFFCEHCYPAGWQRECPGVPPAGYEYFWIGEGRGTPPEEPQVWKA